MTLPPVDQRDHAQAAAQLMETVLLASPNQDMPSHDVLAMAQVFATLAVWAELKRANDRKLGPDR